MSTESVDGGPFGCGPFGYTSTIFWGEAINKIESSPLVGEMPTDKGGNALIYDVPHLGQVAIHHGNCGKLAYRVACYESGGILKIAAA